MASSSRTSLLAAALVAALAAAASWSAADFAWSTFDDPVYVLRQPAVVSPSAASLAQRLGTPSMGHPMPVTAASLALDFARFGYDASGFHRTNIALFAALAALTFLWSRRVLGGGAESRHPLEPEVERRQIVAAAVATVVVMLHPVTAEPVAWITGRKDLLATLLALSALGATAGTGPPLATSGPPPAPP